MSALTLTATLSFTTTTCITCGIVIALPADFNEARLRDQKSFYCANGHSQHYIGKTEEQRLKEQVERLTKEKQWAEQEAKYANEETKKLRTSNIRLRTRAKAGTCPCCKRTFQQLARHMAIKHKDFKP